MAESGKLKLGTRGSRLAMVQAESVARQLTGHGAEIEIVPIKTSGDLGKRDTLGAFVSEIQQALEDGRVDIALHCLKDVPTTVPESLTFGAYLTREDARDAFISKGPSLADLPDSSVIGTGSLRRSSQLAALGKGFQFKPLVGNVDTRIGKLVEGQYDAIILAMAGLSRMGWLSNPASPISGLHVQPLEFETMLPSPGQAVLVLQCRRKDYNALDVAIHLDHPPTRGESLAERSFLARFGGGCSVPVAAKAWLGSGLAHLEGLVASPDGSTVLREVLTGRAEKATQLGTDLANRLGDRGAFRIVEEVVALKGSLK